MNLYINTSGVYCEIALFNDDRVIIKKKDKEAMSHSTVLHNMVESILAEKNVSLKDLKCVAVLNGPGSYTGLRVGLAAAKGYCYSLNIPLILFNKLDLQSDYFFTENKSLPNVACIEPARTGEFFFILKSTKETICEPNVQTTEFINQKIQEIGDVTIISSKSNDIIDINRDIVQTGISIEFIAVKTYNKLINNELSDIFGSEPFYLKKVHVNTPKKRF